jgi:hypothetical protein
MRPTPDYSCWYKYNDDVYEPSEDTFVFLDGLEMELESTLSQKPGLALEIGYGLYSRSKKYDKKLFFIKNWGSLIIHF